MRSLACPKVKLVIQTGFHFHEQVFLNPLKAMKDGFVVTSSVVRLLSVVKF